MRKYRPMLAKPAAEPFSSPDWIFEVKWDGVRAIAYVDADVSLMTRNDRELIRSFPELRELSGLAHEAVLDGEIVVMRQGEPDFQVTARRAHVTDPGEIGLLSREAPANYIVFDILEKGGEPLIGKPLTERKRALAESLREGKYVNISRFVEGDGEGYYRLAVGRGLEGVMAKRKASTYQPGVRSGDWLKIKRRRSCECAVLGYTPGEGARGGSFRALLLGLYEGGKATYVGKVGSGFADQNLQQFSDSLHRLETGEAQLSSTSLPKDVRWVRPGLVAEVEYQNVTRDGMLRAPIFRGLRIDKAPEECTLDQIKPDELGEYASRRDFARSPEPRGGGDTGKGNIYVVQEHHATHLHWDLRLERDGVLKSWAVPKGLPEKPGERRLAVQVEDHPLAYAGFEGTIPEGEYGAGTVKIWDRGTYEALKWTEDKIEVVINGGRLSGQYELIRFRRAGEKEWLLFKRRS